MLSWGKNPWGVFAARQQPGESGDEDPVCVDEDVGPPQALLIRQGAEGARLNGPQSAGEGLHEVRPQVIRRGSVHRFAVMLRLPLAFDEPVDLIGRQAPVTLVAPGVGALVAAGGGDVAGLLVRGELGDLHDHHLVAALRVLDADDSSHGGRHVIRGHPCQRVPEGGRIGARGLEGGVVQAEYDDAATGVGEGAEGLAHRPRTPPCGRLDLDQRGLRTRAAELREDLVEHQHPSLIATLQ